MDVSGSGAPEVAPGGDQVVTTVEGGIDALIQMVRLAPPTRETSLVLTKLQEAKHWWLSGRGQI